MFGQITEVSSLYNAWRKVRANRGAGGVDAVSLREFERNLQDNLQELARNLSNETYQPLPVRFVKVMKSNGKVRELGILTVRDRVVQRAVLDAVESKFESLMQDCNFAFRQGRNLEMAIQQILLARANGYWWTVEADVEDYFKSINREILMKDLCRVTTDGKVLHLIELWLNAGILEETWWQVGEKKIARANAVAYQAITQSLEDFAARRFGTGEDLPDFLMQYDEAAQLTALEEEKPARDGTSPAVRHFLREGFWLAMSHRTLLAKVIGIKMLGIGGLAIAGLALTPTVLETFRQRFHPRKGILQGSPLSPVLANLYLTAFDEKFMRGGDYKLIRYCDDFVILCKSEAEANKALRAAKNQLAKRHLKLHPGKTRVLSPTDEFEFLGYRFLKDGSIEPPPTATNEMARKLKVMSKSISLKFRRHDEKIRVEKIEVKS